MPRSPPVRAVPSSNPVTPPTNLEIVPHDLAPCPSPSNLGTLLLSFIESGTSTTVFTCVSGYQTITGTADLFTSSWNEYVVVNSTTLTTVPLPSPPSSTPTPTGNITNTQPQSPSNATSSNSNTNGVYSTSVASPGAISPQPSQDTTSSRTATSPLSKSNFRSTTPIQSGSSITSPSPSGPVSLTQHQAPTSINSGAIAGGIIAALIFLICCFIIILQRRKRKQAQKNDPSLIPEVLTTTYHDSSEVGHHHTTDDDNRSPGSPLWSHEAPLASVPWSPTTPAISALSTPTPTLTDHSSSSSNNGLPMSVVQWATAELPQQYEILMRENGEFWEEIEQLREENEQLRIGAGATVGVAL